LKTTGICKNIQGKARATPKNTRKKCTAQRHGTNLKTRATARAKTICKWQRKKRWFQIPGNNSLFQPVVTRPYMDRQVRTNIYAAGL